MSKNLLVQNTVLHKVSQTVETVHKQFLSPKDIRPYPKLATNSKKRVRKQGWTRIYTSTPEKNEIELKTQKREEKILKTVKRKVSLEDNKASCSKAKLIELKSEKAKKEIILPSFDERKKKKENKISIVGRRTLKRRGNNSSSSDSDVSYDIKNYSSDSDIDLTEDYELDGLLDDTKIGVGCVQVVADQDEPVVKFLRKNNFGFFYPTQDDIGSVLKENIVLKLPKPKEVLSSTSKLASYMNFDISYNVL
ncbi:hypothetical protein FQR65_LT02251 [Abscondita terminalis]|nr:hypothetical protein FQR65_LT02251 [Abscondita terminalis]